MRRKFKPNHRYMRPTFPGAKVVTTTRQNQVLLLVAKEGPISHIELSRRTGIDRSTLSTMTAQLHEKGLLNKKRARDDTRVVNVNLTTKGRKALTTLPGMYATGMYTR